MRETRFGEHLHAGQAVACGRDALRHEPTLHVRCMLIVGRGAKVHAEQMDAPDRTLPIEHLKQPEETCGEGEGAVVSTCMQRAERLLEERT